MRLRVILVRKQAIGLLLILMIGAAVLLGCQPATPAPPTPTLTPTRAPVVPRNDNVEALNSAAAAVGKIEFGLAPLLLEDKTTIRLETRGGTQVARMRYPTQPADALAWKSADSFVLAVAVRQAMLNSPQVNRVALGQFGVPASVETTSEPVQHTAAWVTFADGTRAIVDLSPLSTNFAPRHIPQQMLVDPVEIENQFDRRRSGVYLNELQPMKVIEADGQLLYLLAKIEVTYDQYRFLLRLHPVQIADPMRSMELSPGITAGVEIDRDEFEKLKELLLQAGPTVFAKHPELLTRQGQLSPQLSAAMDNNLELLWHLITKFQHQQPDPSVPTPTPEPTATPTLTPTPEPTATPKKLPLITS